jgi:hypothetical protein
MRKICTDIIIDSTAENVWNILTDFEKFKIWNPFLQIKTGTAEIGSKIKVLFHIPGSRVIELEPVIHKVDTMRELRWMGKLGVKGLLDGEHVFRIEVLDENRTRFIQCERFRGILSPMFLYFIGRKIKTGFENMNKSLKMESEKKQ